MAMGCADRDHAFCRDHTIRLVLFLLVTLILSCKSTAPHTRSVDLEAADYEQAAALLEKINRLNEQGQYAEAIFAAEKLCKIVEAEKGRDHQGVGVCLNVLGGLYDSFGDYEKAETKLKRALEINRKSGEKDNTQFAASLGLLAKVYMDKGQYRRAEPFAREALRIREAVHGGDDFMVSTSLNTLGEIYLHLHETRKAEPLLLRAIEIRKQHANIHSLVISLNNLCRLYYEAGYYSAAEQLATTALELGEDSLGRTHPHLAETLNLLGKTAASQGRFQDAFQYLKRAQSIDLDVIDDMKGFTSEAQKLKFIEKSQADLHVFLTLILKKLPDSPEALREGMNTLLRRKGIVLDVQKQFQSALFTGDRRMMETFERLSAVRTHLTRLAFAGPGREDPAAYRKEIHNLRDEKERLEIRISSDNQSYRVYLKKAEANCERVAAKLLEIGKCALVELVRVSLYDFDKQSEPRWDKDHYFAFILKAGHPYELRTVDLGEAESVDALIYQMKSALVQIRPQAHKEVVALAARLYGSVFLPVEKELGDRKHIYLSPDGNLNLIPFEIFYEPDAGFLIEKYTFNYVPSGRDIIGYGASPQTQGKTLLFGDPDFDVKTGKNASVATETVASGLKGDAGYRRLILSRNLRFDRLPGTRQEVQAIYALLGEDRTTIYTGEHATEAVLRRMKPPRILHLATHGFFLKDIEVGRRNDRSPARGLTVTAGATQNGSVQKINIENPLLQSGFVLAGANYTLTSTESENFDGVVTAEKILGLKLLGTEMVVLSACNTGIGEVKTGEGVFGLRRAFTQAGAKSLVMSMWSVPDTETRELMVAFYENILAGNMNRCQALRQAALAELAVVEKRYAFPHPLFWGAFVFMGEP
jgi:CHAT domain-containing protein/tetratricopeptide (TPR) repeat protein